ncbi:MAG: SMC-Scp complex subunit ScpB [Candidatus Aenigmatarchaeota archaeon]
MNKKALIEAALFVSEKPLSLERLSKIFDISQEEIKSLMEEMKKDFQRNDRGIELVEAPEGFEFRVKAEYREKVSRLAPLADLSNGMLRSLAIITVKQPIKQSTIVQIQGNKAYGYIKLLEEKGLIKSEKCGRTKLLRTTSEFEKYFGKSVEEVKKMIEEKVK